MYRVLVVDDQMIPRQLFERIINSSDTYSLVDAISSARVVDAYCARYHVDLILMDVIMNDGYSGLEAIKRIKESYPEVKIIIMTSMPDAKLLQEAIAIGADSFWYKEAQNAPILEVMDRTMAGERIFPDRAPQTKLGNAMSTDFTERELEVLRLLSKGFSDKEIAAELFIGQTTVRYHVSNLIAKTGFSSRTGLAIAAVKAGITIL